MAFTSIAFVFVFAATSLLYWILPHRYRSWLLVAAGYYFYASWRAEHLLGTEPEVPEERHQDVTPRFHLSLLCILSFQISDQPEY